MVLKYVLEIAKKKNLNLIYKKNQMIFILLQLMDIMIEIMFMFIIFI